MSGQWKPGDVALVRCGSSDWHRAMRIESAIGDADWYCQHGGGHPIKDLYEISPLTVVDTEDPQVLDALGKAWDEAESCDLDNEQPMTMRALRMRIALRSLGTPPNPPEPTGDYAVVGTDTSDAYVRAPWGGSQPWFRLGDDRGHHWNDIAAVAVLSEGVTS